MIEDGYWSSELEAELKFIKGLKKHKLKYHFSYEHKINKSILFSAVIMRKMFEDEKEVDTIYNRGEITHRPALKILDCKALVKEYPFTGDKSFIIDRPVPENYEGGEIKIVELKLNELCNQILHSFIWAVVYSSDLSEACGLMFASNNYKDKKLYVLDLDEWIKVLEYCIENNTLKQRR